MPPKPLTESLYIFLFYTTVTMLPAAALTPWGIRFGHVSHSCGKYRKILQSWQVFPHKIQAFLN
jgi:hypothetical protein